MSSIDPQPTTLSAFGKFVSEVLESSPMQSFLVLVFVFILSLVVASWLMVQWWAPGPSSATIDPTQCGRADAVKAGSYEAAWRSKE